MQPNPETIEQYRRAYFREFKEDISPEEACEQLDNLVRLLQVIRKPQAGRSDPIPPAPPETDLTKTGKVVH